MADVQILTLSCDDKPGITARVTGYLYAHGGNVLEAQQFNDLGSGTFFMRVEFDPVQGCQALSPGPRARGQDDRRDRALCDRGFGRGSDHPLGRRERQPC